MGCTGTRLDPVMRKIDSIQSDILKNRNFDELNCLITKNYRIQTIKSDKFLEIKNEIINLNSQYLILISKIFDNMMTGNEILCKDINLFLFSITDHDNPPEDFFNIIMMEDNIEKRRNSHINIIEELSNSNKRLIYRTDMENSLKKLIYFNTNFMIVNCEFFLDCTRQEYDKLKQHFSDNNINTIIIYILNEMDNFQIKNISSISNAKKYFDIFDVKILFENFPWLVYSAGIRNELELHAINKI